MAEDWNVGDIALCLKSTTGELGSKSNTQVGAKYIVTATRWARNRVDGTDGVGLCFAGYVVTRTGGRWFDARAFRKLPRHIADEFDRETIALLTGAGQEVGA